MILPCTADSFLHDRYLNPVNFTAARTFINQPEVYAAYAIHQSLYTLLAGSIFPNALTVITDTSHIAMSALVEDTPFPLETGLPYRSISAQKPVRNLRQVVQDLHFNITVGLLSLAPHLVYSENGTAVADTFDAKNVWIYDPFVLVLVYSIAAFLDLVTIVIGIVAMIYIGGASGFEFARVLATTRASERLYAVASDWEDGMDPIPCVAEKTRIMFGEVVGSDGRRRVGFGLEGEVDHISK